MTTGQEHVAARRLDDRTSTVTHADPSTPADVAHQMGRMARHLQEQPEVGDALRSIVHAAVSIVPGAQYAGISVVEGRATMRTPIFSDDLVAAVDRAQIDLDEGPCLDVLYQRHTVHSADLADEPRWPRFAARAVELGVRSMMAFQLYVKDGDLGGLNLYSRHPGAFADDDSEEIGMLLATHAAVAIADALRIADLTRAVASRDIIGQAKGILMERHNLSDDQAFALLVRMSQTTNTKLVKIATYIIDKRRVPPGAA
ncbi:ANTAR domain-containing protein [Jiangella ureilytica]|uniref:ANTAR domain-containing protein n=1 Tax=Jiangella ureilytica TaxID=2530374 RepID=A0A4R4RT55_9ACTN|nr:GAF and ANTAR domain-containing protein [Jiangella ureilytica]TDC53231.1 ANTAR domain-containing protein [Jiangella ureilytica]